MEVKIVRNVLICFCLILFATSVSAMGNRRPSPETTVKIDSLPQGAVIIIDYNTIGTTPVYIKIAKTQEWSYLNESYEDKSWIINGVDYGPSVTIKANIKEPQQITK